MADYNLVKGHDIKIAGIPKNSVVEGAPTEFVALNPSEFRGAKPKLLVQEGDQVKIGTPLFHDKTNPKITWPSPGAGEITEIKYGPRRIIEKIMIKLSDDESSESFSSYNYKEINNLSRDDVLSALLKGSIFPFIRQRPFSKVPDPDVIPRDIFISGWNSGPLAVNLDLALRRRLPQFQAGVDILNKLTEGEVHLSYNENTVSDTLLHVSGVRAHTFNGPHPAGNVGIQIHHISPINLIINNIKIESSLNENRADICKKKILLSKILIPGEKFRDLLKKYGYDSDCLSKADQISIEIDNILQSHELIIENEDFNKINFISYDKENKFNYINNLSFINKKGQNFIFDTGSYVINEPLIIPNGYNLVIQNGTEISFSKDSYIHISNGDLLSLGTKNKVNKLKALNDTWGGILVSNSNNSIIKNTIFEKTDYFNNRKSNIYLTGAINFYKSKVNFEKVKFFHSIAEDALNIINSEFILNDIVFNGSISDALDLDFSKGTISNFKFSEINGDAIDTSGSKVYLKNGTINKVDDKAISIGENSEIKAEKISISNSLIGLAIKDNSILNLNKVSFQNNNNDISAYLKKAFYRNGGKAFINNYSPDTILIKKDKFSQLILNDKEFKKANFKYDE